MNLSIRRVVPTITTTAMNRSREFYEEFLGLQMAMDMGWIVTFVSPDNPTAQLSLVQRNDAETGVETAAAAQLVSLSIEVGNVDQLHREAAERGYAVVHPLTDEPWGVRRFHVLDPNGIVVNVMCHLPQQEPPAEPG